MDTSSRKLAADYDSVASQTSSRKLAADVDHETSVRSVFESVSKEKRDRDFNVVQTLRDRQNLHKNLERKAESAARGEKLVQQRLLGAEADVEVKHWEKRNSDIALHEINQEFESQRLQLQQANHWDDQAQGEKISLCGELEVRNRLFRENRAKDCQDIEELRRICFEETDRARQARIDELSMHQERNPATVSQLLTQILELQNKVNYLSDAREFYDSETATHGPSQPSTIAIPRTIRSRDSGLPHDTRNIMGTSGNVFERPPAREGRTSTLFNNSKNLASSSQETRPDIPRNTKRPKSEMRREPQNSSILVPRFQSGGGVKKVILVELVLTVLHLGQFPDSVEFLSWKVNFKTEVCSKSTDPRLIMHWIKEVETAKSIDELVTSRSILERTEFL